MADNSLPRGLRARRIFLQALGLSSLTAALAIGQEQGELKEPVFRMAKALPGAPGAPADSHPLDPGLRLAHETLANIHFGSRMMLTILSKNAEANKIFNEITDHDGRVQCINHTPSLPHASPQGL